MITETKAFLFEETEPIKAKSVGGETRIIGLELGSLQIELSMKNARELAAKLNEEVFSNLASMAGEAACKILGTADWVKEIGVKHFAEESFIGVYVVTDKPLEIGMHREIVEIGMVISKALGESVRAAVVREIDEGTRSVYLRKEPETAPAECGAA